MTFEVTLYQDEDGWWVVGCPSIPGCVSQGVSMEEALMNIKEAIELCLEVRAEYGMPLTIEPEPSEADHGTFDHSLSGTGIRDERLQTRCVVEVAFEADLG